MKFCFNILLGGFRITAITTDWWFHFTNEFIKYLEPKVRLHTWQASGIEIADLVCRKSICRASRNSNQISSEFHLSRRFVCARAKLIHALKPNCKLCKFKCVDGKILAGNAFTYDWCWTHVTSLPILASIESHIEKKNGEMVDLAFVEETGTEMREKLFFSSSSIRKNTNFVH